MKDLDTKTEPILPPAIHNYEPIGESKRTKRINKIIVLALAIIAICLSIMFYWATVTDKVITLNQDPFPTRTIRNQPTAGGVVFLTTDYCKSTNAMGDLRISFVSHTREIFLPMIKESGGKGCRNTELAVLIPDDIQPGVYKIKLSLTYDINPLKQNVNQAFVSREIVIHPISDTNKLPVDTSPNAR